MPNKMDEVWNDPKSLAIIENFNKSKDILSEDEILQCI